MPLPIFKGLTDADLKQIRGAVSKPYADRTSWEGFRLDDIAKQAIDEEVDIRHPEIALARKYKNALLDIQRASCAAYAVASGLAEEVKGIVKQALEGD